jgi:uncharacterized protein
VSSIDQANRLPEDFEPLLVEGDTIPLTDLIEDELLLSLPTYPKHQHSCFAANSDKIKTTTSVPDSSSLPENPFSILATLKKSGDL